MAHIRNTMECPLYSTIRNLKAHEPEMMYKKICADAYPGNAGIFRIPSPQSGEKLSYQGLKVKGMVFATRLSAAGCHSIHRNKLQRYFI